VIGATGLARRRAGREKRKCGAGGENQDWIFHDGECEKTYGGGFVKRFALAASLNSLSKSGNAKA
jgi:hypothetical protein